LGLGACSPRKKNENLGVNVFDFNQIFTAMPPNMDYLITEFGTVPFLKALGK